jgi:hypothetical protein
VTERITRLGYWRGLGDGWSTRETVRYLVASETGMGALASPDDRRLDDDRDGGLFGRVIVERYDHLDFRRDVDRLAESRSLLFRSRSDRSEPGG